MKILIIDDDKDCLDSLEIALKPFNYDITKETDPFKAYELIQTKIFDLVITDIKMPLMNGIEILYNTKKFYSETKIFIMSAFQFTSGVNAFIEMLADAKFEKPINIETLFNKIKLLVN